MSRTGQAVALARARLDRPYTPDGDPSAQRRLCAGMPPVATEAIAAHVAARTRFFDGEVLRALGEDVEQVVICGAGYDDRALRFRSAGVRFFELDHPVTQDDKRRHLEAMAADTTGLLLLAADFGTDDVADLLAAGGHDAHCSSLFACEGLLVYLEPATCHGLLAGLRSRAAPGSRLAASLAVHADGLDSAGVAAVANARRLSGVTEPWRTILPLDDHVRLLAAAGWQVTTCTGIAGLGRGRMSGGSVVISAVPDSSS